MSMINVVVEIARYIIILYIGAKIALTIANTLNLKIPNIAELIKKQLGYKEALKELNIPDPLEQGIWKPEEDDGC